MGSCRGLWLGFAASLAVLSGCQCGCQHQQPSDPDADAEAPPADAIMDASDTGHDAARDSGPTTWSLDAWVPRDACDATTIELPPSGLTQIAQVSNMGRYVVYDDIRTSGDLKHADVYLYDLDTCTEYQLTNKDWVQITPYIWDTEIVFADRTSEFGSVELVRFDISTLTFTQLSSGAKAYWPYYNSSYIVYESSLGLSPNEGNDLMLWDLQSDQEVMLVEHGHGVENVSISSTHAAWVAFGGPDKDVFYVDLATKEITHVESTFDPYVAHTGTWGDWVVWEDTRYGGLDIMGLQISAGTEVRLVDNGAYNGWPTLRESVMCFRTTLWSGVYGDWDLAVYDLDTGVTRRVTQQSNWGNKCGFVDSGWLVYPQQMLAGSFHRNKIWAVNLQKLGILNAQGHVVP